MESQKPRSKTHLGRLVIGYAILYKLCNIICKKGIVIYSKIVLIIECIKQLLEFLAHFECLIHNNLNILLLWNKLF